MMNPFRRRVSFAAKNEFSRLPFDDELYVMNKFARHADKCDSCYDPWMAYKKGSTLCPEGHKRAIDVAQYVYTRGDRSFSHLDDGQKHCVQIEIPANCEATRLLLKAMDRGLRVMRNKAPSSYDKSYYVPARLSVPDNHRSMPATRPATSYTSQPAVPTTPKMAPAKVAASKPAPPQMIAPKAAPVKASSSKASPQETVAVPSRRSHIKFRTRSSSTSSNSSTDSNRSRSRSRSTTRNSAPTRSSRPYFVRSRSKDGKPSSSPVFIRTTPSKTGPQVSVKEIPRPTAAASHSRDSSTSSNSSTNSRRSSGLFSWGSRSSSRNSSVSSQDSLVDYTPAPASLSKPASGPGKPPIAFRDPQYQDASYQKIAPKNAVSPPGSPGRRAQAQPRSVR